MHYADGSSYVGQFENDIRHGQGKFIACDGSVQEGKWENDAFVPASE